MAKVLIAEGIAGIVGVILQSVEVFVGMSVAGLLLLVVTWGPIWGRLPLRRYRFQWLLTSHDWKHGFHVLDKRTRNLLAVEEGDQRDFGRALPVLAVTVKKDGLKNAIRMST